MLLSVGHPVRHSFISFPISTCVSPAKRGVRSEATSHIYHRQVSMHDIYSHRLVLLQDSEHSKVVTVALTKIIRRSLLELFGSETAEYLFKVLELSACHDICSPFLNFISAKAWFNAKLGRCWEPQSTSTHAELLHVELLAILDLRVHSCRESQETLDCGIVEQFQAMLTTQLLLAPLAFLALFAKIAATFANLSAAIRANHSSTENLHTLGLPSPDGPLNFDYPFRYIFQGGKCSAKQINDIAILWTHVALLGDRVNFYWNKDPDHDWQPDMDYWFGKGSRSYETWIKSNAILLQSFHCRPTD